jgi:hypothetical protein
MRAHFERRSVSGCMLHILVRAVRFEELIFSQLNRLAGLDCSVWNARFLPSEAKQRFSCGAPRKKSNEYTNCRKAQGCHHQQTCDVLPFTFTECGKHPAARSARVDE